MKIAVYAIAKNEEQFVERWYNSAKDADYLFILDTGSSDNTVELAKSLGINVEVKKIDPWRFDVARNEAVSCMPKDIDYCIALDMDEVLVEGWRDHLEKISPSTTRPRYKYTWSWKEDGTPGLQYNGDKIHTRNGYKWKHPVHEVMIPQGITEIQELIGLEIHHHPDRTKSRSQYFPLLKMAIEEDPDNDRNAYYYARELYFYNHYEEAAKEFKRHLSLPSAVWKPERANSMRYLAKCELENKEYWINKAIDECPGRREALMDLATYYYENKKWKECFETCLKVLEIKERPLEYLCEEQAWGSGPYDFAAISCYNLGQYQDALLYGIEAYMMSPNNERLKNNLRFYIDGVKK